MLVLEKITKSYKGKKALQEVALELPWGIYVRDKKRRNFRPSGAQWRGKVHSYEHYHREPGSG